MSKLFKQVGLFFKRVSKSFAQMGLFLKQLENDLLKGFHAKMRSHCLFSCGRSHYFFIHTYNSNMCVNVKNSLVCSNFIEFWCDQLLNTKYHTILTSHPNCSSVGMRWKNSILFKVHQLLNENWYLLISKLKSSTLTAMFFWPSINLQFL